MTIPDNAPIECKQLDLLSPNKQSDLFVVNYDRMDAQKAIDLYSSKGSVKNSSSGILEVLHTLETDETKQSEQERHLITPSTQSHQDLSTDSPEIRENKRFALKSLLKRTHSAPKQIGMPKKRYEIKKQPSFCCSIVDKLKSVTEKQLSSKHQKQKKPSSIKTTHLVGDNKIVLAEHTRIIRLKDSPKADRSKTAYFPEKDSNDDILEIIMLDESPGESRKRRERPRIYEKQRTSADRATPEDPIDEIDHGQNLNTNFRLFNH